jgi:hypothetical protein
MFAQLPNAQAACPAGVPPVVMHATWSRADQTGSVSGLAGSRARGSNRSYAQQMTVL